MSNWNYTARARFAPDAGDRWTNYIEWSGFSHIEELVTLDNLLCPELINELLDDDWSYNVQADYRVTWFHDLEYLRRRCDWRRGLDQIIAMFETPLAENEPPNGFVRCGFDILDGYDSVSVLTNCGRFPGIVEPKAVNGWGLLPDLATANSTAERLRAAFPDEPHCSNGRVWQVARDAQLRS